MGWLLWLLFESFAALAAACAIACFIALVGWRRGGRPRNLLAVMAISAVLMLANLAVTTHRERAAALLDAIARDVIAGRTAALERALAADFDAGALRGQPLDRAAFLELVRRLLVDVDIIAARRTELVVESSTADKVAVAAAYLSEASFAEFRGSFRSRWRLTLSAGPGGWRIARIEPLFVDGLPTASWDAISEH